MFRKLLAVLLTVSMLAALFSGCAKQETQTVEPAEQQNASEPAEQAATEEPAAAPAESKVLRLAASDSAAYPLCKADTFFAEKVAELSDNSLKVDCYFDGVLGEEGDTIESLNLGLLELSRVSAGNMATFVPELALFNLPFLFKDVDHFWSVLNGDVGEIYKQLFEKAGFKLVAFYDEGTRNIFSKTKCIVTPEDLAGVKIRTMGVQSIQDAFAALGASPTPMSSGEVYTSLSQGLLDACENNFSTVYTLKWYESAKYFTNTEHLRVPSVLVCGLEYWNSLSAQEQDVIMQAAAASVAYASEIFDSEEAAAREALLAEGCVYQELTAEQKAAFAEKCANVYLTYTQDAVSKDIFDKIVALGN